MQKGMVRPMLIAVFSDTHGYTGPMLRAVRACGPDMVLHLGDHARDAEELRGILPGLDVRCVRGNCDLASAAPERLTFSVEGVDIFMTHGHLYSVKFTLDSLTNAAHFAGARLALFGHTHQSEYRNYGDLALLNPGSAGMGEMTFGLLTVEGGSWQWKLEKL